MFCFFFSRKKRQSNAGIISVRHALSSLSGRERLSLVSRGQRVSGVSFGCELGKNIRYNYIRKASKNKPAFPLPHPRPHLTRLLPLGIIDILFICYCIRFQINKTCMFVCMYLQHGRWGFWIPDSGFQSLPVELGFWITIVSGIPDSLSCIPDLKAQDSEFHKQKVPGFRIPQAKNSRILESRFPYMGYEGRRACSQAILNGVVVVVVCLFFRFFPFHAPFNHRAWNNYRAGAGHIVRSNVILLGHRHFWPDKFNPS